MMIHDGENTEELEELSQKQLAAFKRMAHAVMGEINKTDLTVPAILKEVGDAVSFIVFKTAKDMHQDCDTLVHHAKENNIPLSTIIQGLTRAMRQSADQWHKAFEEVANEASGSTDKALSQLSAIMNNTKPPTGSKH